MICLCIEPGWPFIRTSPVDESSAKFGMPRDPVRNGRAVVQIAFVPIHLRFHANCSAFSGEAPCTSTK